MLVYVPGRAGGGIAEKSRQCWQCQAPVTQCPAGLAGVREGRAPETQGPPPDASGCGFAHSGFHYIRQSSTLQHVGLSLPSSQSHQEHTCGWLNKVGLCPLQRGRTCSMGTWVSQWEGKKNGCGFRPVLGEGFALGCTPSGSTVAL